MCSPHTSYRWRGERVIEPIKCMQSPHTSYRWRGASHRANQVYALTTHQLQVERRESHRNNQVYALTTHQLQVERRERVIEPIKCMRSPHTSYRWRGERVVTYIGRNSTGSTGHRKNQRLSKTPPPPPQRKSARFLPIMEQRNVARTFPKDIRSFHDFQSIHKEIYGY